MLILRRVEGESIMVGDNVEVIVTKINGHIVHLKVIASGDIPILYGENLQILEPEDREDILRQVDEVILTGYDVEVMIFYINGKGVGLSVTAPKSILVHRREIYDAIQREKKD